MSEYIDTPELESGEVLLDEKGGRRKLLSSKFDIPRPYNDLIFAVLFLCNFIVIISIVVTNGISAIEQKGSSITTVNPDNTQVIDSSSNSATKFVSGIFLVLLFGSFLSVGWVQFMAYLSNELITYTFGIIIVISIFAGVAFFTSGVIPAGIALMILALLIFIMFLYLRPRMDLAATTLKIACEAIKALPMTFFYSVGLLGVQSIYCLLWTFAALGVATNESKSTIQSNGKTYQLDQCSTFYYSTYVDIAGSSLSCSNTNGKYCAACVCNGNVIVSARSCFTPRLYGWTYFLLLLSLFWGCTVLTNVVLCTTSGAVSSWWRKRPSELVSGAEIVKSSFLHAVTSSFGSICLGSLLVAVVKTTRTLVKFTLDNIRPTHRNQVNGGLYGIPGCSSIQIFLIQVLDTMLRWLDNIMDYFNRYAFCYVSIYGYSFLESSKAVLEMFRRRGLTAVINDDIIEVVLSLGHLVVAVSCSIFAFLFAKLLSLNGVNTSLLTASGFFAGYLLCAVMLKVISAAVATVYVCFAEDAEEFQVAHPELYHELCFRWGALYPNSMPPGIRAPACSQQSKGDDVDLGAGFGAASVNGGDFDDESKGYHPPTAFGMNGSFWGKGSATNQPNTSAATTRSGSNGQIYSAVGTVGDGSDSILGTDDDGADDDISVVVHHHSPVRNDRTNQSGLNVSSSSALASSQQVISSVGAGAVVVYEEFSRMFRPGESGAAYYPPNRDPSSKPGSNNNGIKMTSSNIKASQTTTNGNNFATSFTVDSRASNFVQDHDHYDDEEETMSF